MALSKPVILRIILIVLVFFVLAVTLVGHFGSDWTHPDKNSHGHDPYSLKIYMYESCDFTNYNNDCPNISMERFYVVMLFLCFFGAIASTLLEYFNTNDNRLRLVDFILLVFLGFLLLISVITFLVSTILVQDYIEFLNKKKRNEDKEYDSWYQWIIKLIASVFGLAVVIFHSYLAYLIGKPGCQEFKRGRAENAEARAASQWSVQASPSMQGAEVKAQYSIYR